MDIAIADFGSRPGVGTNIGNLMSYELPWAKREEIITSFLLKLNMRESEKHGRVVKALPWFLLWLACTLCLGVYNT